MLPRSVSAASARVKMIGIFHHVFFFRSPSFPIFPTPTCPVPLDLTQNGEQISGTYKIRPLTHRQNATRNYVVSFGGFALFCCCCTAARYFLLVVQLGGEIIKHSARHILILPPECFAHKMLSCMAKAGKLIWVSAGKLIA